MVGEIVKFWFAADGSKIRTVLGTNAVISEVTEVSQKAVARYC
ncbi:MAG: hypothetical protein RM347_033980 [Nostoc sp. ChiQUE02]